MRMPSSRFSRALIWSYRSALMLLPIILLGQLKTCYRQQRPNNLHDSLRSVQAICRSKNPRSCCQPCRLLLLQDKQSCGWLRIFRHQYEVVLLESYYPSLVLPRIPHYNPSNFLANSAATPGPNKTATITPYSKYSMRVMRLEPAAKLFWIDSYLTAQICSCVASLASVSLIIFSVIFGFRYLRFGLLFNLDD